VVFTLTVDAATGVTTLTQSRAVVHGNPEDHDEALTPATISDGSITMTATVTDGDGDTASDSIDVGTLLALEDDGPTANDDAEVETNEDTAITFNVLTNDGVSADGVEISAFSQPENGLLVLNENNTFTYTPADNLQGEETFTYTLTDGDGDTSTATVTINVEAVADAPNLILSIGDEVINTTPLIINLDNVSTTGNGFEVTAYNISGGETTISTVSGTNHDGFGVTGTASGANSEIGSNTTASERLKVEFGNTVNSINVNFAWLSGIETAAYTFYLEGVAVGSGTTAFQTDRVDGVFTLSPTSGEVFDRVDFTAPLNNTDDYLINSITFDNVTSYSYNLNVIAGFTDVDGSETLGDVTIASLPSGTTLVGSTLTSDTPLTDVQVNAITASVTSTEASNSDVATTTVTTKIVFSGLDATAETADLLIEGTTGADTIIGGAGDDIIFGDSGSDSLTGGAGADMFIWNEADVAIGTVDTVVDFNSAEDVINLSDLLSDGSHSVEGIDNTTGGSHLQLDIKDSGGVVVQSIDLNGVAIVGTAEDTLQSLLNSGAINDGI
jgi:Ca2+-binding RTX toxin-like protein